jgi:hypothetical protein
VGEEWDGIEGAGGEGEEDEVDGDPLTANPLQRKIWISKLTLIWLLLKMRWIKN